MPKPTELPAWATDTDANVVAPTTSLKQNGWLGNAVPTAQNFNWLFKRIGQWLTWLGDRFTDDGGVKRIQTVEEYDALDTLPAVDGDIVNVNNCGLYRFAANPLVSSTGFPGSGGRSIYFVTGAGGWYYQEQGILGYPFGPAKLGSNGKILIGHFAAPVRAFGTVGLTGATVGGSIPALASGFPSYGVQSITTTIYASVHVAVVTLTPEVSLAPGNKLTVVLGPAGLGRANYRVDQVTNNSFMVRQFTGADGTLQQELGQRSTADNDTLSGQTYEGPQFTFLVTG